VVAVIVTWPNVTALTRPVEFTVAIAELLLDHVNCPVSTFPIVSVTFAASCIC
jgi:hypothetical protein